MQQHPGLRGDGLVRPIPRKLRFVVVALVVLVALLGGLATELGPWYFGLKQPFWKPPDWAFGPAWTLIFGCVAVSAMGAWHAATRRHERSALALGFGLNALLNIAWSVLFFKLQMPLWAGIEVLALWASIAWLIASIRRYNPAAAAWLLPYLVWVSYAATINWGVVWLNAEASQGPALQDLEPNDPSPKEQAQPASR
jgi:tryptophan-rich sensory protein